MNNNYSPLQKVYLKKLGSKIRVLRQKKKLSQEELAEKANLDRTYISAVERGERNIAVLNLKKIANALKTNIASLFNDVDS